jgi:glutathione synthase/RimK-type ligase-like ATP-grasp enzyme
MTILILGQPDEIHAAAIYDRLQQQGVEAFYFNTATFPTRSRLTWYPDRDDGYLELATGEAISMSGIKSVYWRNFNDVLTPELTDTTQAMIAYNDSISLMRTFLNFANIKWVNSWQAYQFHKEKPRQLSVVSKLNVNIPKTLVTNHPQQLSEFVASLDRAIFKPVYGGSHTKLITPEFLEPERLNLVLKVAPVKIQEYISGTNIRTYVIGDRVYSAEIKTDAVDFRDDDVANLIPMEIPPNLAVKSIEIARSLSLEWTAIDWRQREDGEYFFLEANPSPMFYYFEQQTNYPIAQSLIDLLLLEKGRKF